MKTLPAALLVISALCLTGCEDTDDGSSNQLRGNRAVTEDTTDVKDLVASAKATMRGLSSMHIEGDLSTDGKDIAVDVTLAADGDCAGTFKFLGGTAELLATDGQMWLRPDAVIWEQFAPSNPEAVKAYVGDKWVQSDDLGGVGEIGQFCTFDAVVGKAGTDDADAAYEDRGHEFLGGTEVVKVKRDGADGPTVAYIQQAEPHYILQTEREGDSSATLRYSDFDVPLTIDAPTADEVVELPS